MLEVRVEAVVLAEASAGADADLAEEVEGQRMEGG